MKRHFNLLPDSFRRRIAVRRRLLAWGAAWLATCGLGAAACLFERQHRREVQRERAAVQRQADPLVQLKSQIDRLREELTEIGGDERELGQLMEDRPMASLMALVSRSVEQCERQLRLDSLDVAAARTTDDGPQPRTVHLEGDAESHVAVMQFVSALRDTKAFARVEIQSTSQREEQHHGFQVECSF